MKNIALVEPCLHICQFYTTKKGKLINILFSLSATRSDVPASLMELWISFFTWLHLKPASTLGGIFENRHPLTFFRNERDMTQSPLLRSLFILIVPLLLSWTIIIIKNENKKHNEIWRPLSNGKNYACELHAYFTEIIYR